jgi:hypothetical protein
MSTLETHSGGLEQRTGLSKCKVFDQMDNSKNFLCCIPLLTDTLFSFCASEVPTPSTFLSDVLCIVSSLSPNISLILCVLNVHVNGSVHINFCVSVCIYP